MLEQLYRNWWILLIRGLCAIACGVAVITWPAITLLVLVWLYGGFCLVEGIAGIVIGVSGGPEGKRIWWPMVCLGILAWIAGLVAIFYPGLTVLVLLMVIAVSAIVRGILEIAAAIALRKMLDDEWVLILSGLLSIGFGGLLVAMPGEGALAMVLLIGGYLTAVGVMAVALSLRLRSLGKKHLAGGVV
jgi:uncharacterized membrane protein HdeD (DUF308 family)